MQIGYFAIGIGPTVDPEWVRTVVTTAERLGFSTVWAPEHVVLLDEYASKYPYSSGQVPRADGYPDRGSLRDISLCGCVHDQDPAGDRHLPRP